MSMQCPSPSFLITFGWKSILLDIRMATPACFLGPFAWKLFFPTFYFEGISVFDSVFSCMQQNAGSWLHIQSVGLCPFIGELSPLMLRDIRDQWLLLPVIFVVTGRIMFVCFSFFVVTRLISCFFLGVVSLLVLDFSFYYPL